MGKTFGIPSNFHPAAGPGQPAGITEFSPRRPKPVISLILPVLNEAPILAGALSNLPLAPDLEILLVDGGSTDATREVAGRFPHIRWVSAPRGRGGQMNAGARVARGDFFLFLHIDTALTTEHLAALRQAAWRPPGRGRGLRTPPDPAHPLPQVYRLGGQLARPPVSPALWRPGHLRAPGPVPGPGRLCPSPPGRPGPGAAA